ncbi:MAG TPA: protoporphyrinogen oxidase [Gemmatimonadales bacterium]|nr:protoporphyrinogen oxidase [Gemmatimonadales bacterium]
MRRIVVIGGGISGLAAAWSAQRVGGHEVLVLERAPQVGGKARSISQDGWLVEGGPSGYLGGRPELERLIDDVGLSGERVPANAASARRFLFRAGRMRRLIANPVGLLTEGVLGPGGVARMLAEPFIPRRRDGADESVWNFAARRLGSDVADRMILPMALGIFAGDARRLSLAAAFPRMAALEREHGSLIRGMIARRKGPGPGGLSSFRLGMQQLPRTLAERGGFTVRCNASVIGLARAGARWLVAVAGDREPIPADGVILAGEPWSVAPLLVPHDERLAAELAAIPCPPVAVVALGYAPAAAARIPKGFGVLISRGEGFRMLGNLWEAQLYPGRGPAQHALVRTMYGGAVDPEAGALSEGELVALARTEVARLYGISDAPVLEQVVRWPRAIPQYEIGHPVRVMRIEAAVSALPGLAITGNGLRGVSFADAATDGLRTGEALARQLRA